MVERSAPNENPPIVWKHCMEEDQLPVQDYRHTLRELPKDKLSKEDEQDDFVLIQEKINPRLVKFPVKLIVYHKQHSFLEVKKALPHNKYQCKFNGQEKPDVVCEASELSDSFTVKVLVKQQNSESVSILRVNLSDQILDSVKEKTSSSSLQIIYKGKLLEKDDTFQRLMVKPEEMLLAVSSKIEGKKWFRFPHYISPSYFYMSESSWDALDILPQQNMYFIGVLFYMNRDKKDFHLTWGAKLDDNELYQPEKELDVTDEVGIPFQGPDNNAAKYMELLLDEPLQMNAGQKITIKAKVKCADANRHFYGYDGYENYVEKIEGQDPKLFKTVYSNSNQNSTDTGYGQFPGFIYALM